MFPACALFLAAKRKGHDATIITDKRGEAFCSNISGKIVLNTVRFSYENLLDIACYSLLTAIKFLKLWIRVRPDVVIGFGGIFTVIPILIAKVLGSKIVVYEQNSVLGKANKFLERFADLKLASFRLNGSWIHVPPIVRDEFIKNSMHEYKCDGIIKILIIGGSQGAASFSRIVPQALATLSSKERENIEIIQQASDCDKLGQTYKDLGVRATLKQFLNNVAEIMQSSQVVICRSGASTLSELSAIGRPAVLIPYPGAADNHQFYNATYYKSKKAAWVLEENDGIAEELGNILRQILENRELLKKMSSHITGISTCSADDFIELVERIFCQSFHY
jgi:UDP-N-acetylglucosamine--N-acetylmuramyl-(pentapeptide) pyrophosphoryl-undecaprenol N-acetylglucosamine transferase